jgi:C1A family cysteine protease
MGGYLIPSIDFLITEGVATNSCKPYVYDKGECDFKCFKKDEEYKKYFCEASSMKIMTNIEEM